MDESTLISPFSPCLFGVIQASKARMVRVRVVYKRPGVMAIHRFAWYLLDPSASRAKWT
ncbi:hypothetical protein [Timonella senegalensis]|uniref:hypothetical protein n=1 Tax=Timonella senegalensis TaxID=1465825 RepID=UPI002FDF1BE1